MEKIWLKHYPKNMPEEINPEAYSSLVELFEISCKKYADRSALANLGSTMTYAQLYAKSSKFAAYLQNKLKAKKGDRIAIMLPNLMQYPVVLFGALMAGLTVVNLNPLYTVPEVVKQLNDSGAKTIVVLANVAHVLQHAVPETRITNVIVTEIGDLCGFIKGTFLNFFISKIKKKVPQWYIPYAVSFRRIINNNWRLRFNKVTVKGDDVAFLQYTGGTTGISKGAILTHRNLVANVEQCFAWIGDFLQEGQEISITALPLYHIFSMTICCLCFTKIGAMQLLITNPRDTSGFAKSLAKYPFTIFCGLTTMFNALLNTSDFKKLDFSSLKLTVAGGMAVQTVVAEKWQKLTGNMVLEGYGLTEASPVVSMTPLDQHNFVNSIGVPVPSTLVSIRDEHGNEVALGEEGELCVKGPQVMQGYWNMPNETKQVFHSDGWLRTGDVAVMDETGHLYLVDRKKDMIVVAGYNVYPTEIEQVIMAHPAVKEVAVVGVPSVHAGEVVKAFIVKKDETLNKEKLIAFCKDRLTSYKVPKRVEFRDELPKSNVGKILRRALREEG